MSPIENQPFAPPQEGTEGNSEIRLQAPSDDEEDFVENYMHDQYEAVDDEALIDFNEDVLAIEKAMVNDFLAQLTNTIEKDYLFNFGSDAAIKLRALPPTRTPRADI